MLVRLARSLCGGHRLRQDSTRIDDEKLLSTVRRQARRLGMRAAPAVAWCQRVSVPLMVGILKPVILLPTSLSRIGVLMLCAVFALLAGAPALVDIWAQPLPAWRIVGVSESRNHCCSISEETMSALKKALVLVAAAAAVAVLQLPAAAQKPKLVYAKDGSGVFGYKHTPVQPWSGYHVHDPDRPAPERVEPGQPGREEQPGTAPSDALVLFGGSDLSQWQPTKWKVEDGCLVATEGPLDTKEEFGSCQLHLEWQAPVERADHMMNRGNNGVMLLGAIEVQIFESHGTKIYPDGQAAAIYAQTPPLVNACRKPGEWQTYDIVFLAPKFDDAGKLLEPARLTMFHNGLLVHHNQEIYGNSPHAQLASYKPVKAKAPLCFGAHHCPVRFRNIWIRPLEHGQRQATIRSAESE
jgi:hypothetical protein